jgi:peptidoglycan/LPS O-acetylase OafA/YrhL
VGERISGLDGVRGFAIILVLLWHYVAMQLTHQPGSVMNFVRQILGGCWSGVDLFFVLSGFLLGGILIENRDSPNYFRTF